MHRVLQKNLVLTVHLRCRFDAFGSKWHFPQADASRIEDRVPDCRGDDRDCSFARKLRSPLPLKRHEARFVAGASEVVKAEKASK